ncbi:MAG: 50S ribosome-binding GTPase, partial [Bacteroidetes bacterium]|nr:50S ribosome-binding GTPase [Bacteroidota bacterium]
KGAESISALTGLTSLDISDNEIGDKGAESISALTGLTSLNISGNKIGEKGAESISALTGLTSLNIWYNEIGEKGAESISALSGLTSLDISDNEIGEKGAESISALSGLTSLDISGNKINHTQYFKNLKNINFLQLWNSLLRDVPESIVENYNCIDDLRIWWKETEDKKNVKPNKIVKLQIIGNGNAGKSSIIEALKNEVCKIEFTSTHGIVIEPLNYMSENKEINFQAWDFGGQEIYHGTHKLFISSQSIHLLIADDESEQYALDQKKVPDRENPEELVLHQPLQHYIDLSKRQSPNSIRIIVKNKADKKTALLTKDLCTIAEKNKTAFQPVSATQGTGINVLRNILAEKRKDILHYGMLMPVSWLDVQQYFIDNLKGPVFDRRRLISMDKFQEICGRYKVSGISIQALLNFLHHTGIIYKNEELLKNIIIADQKWALEAIYKPLDRKSAFYHTLRNDFKGRVRLKDLFKAFGDGYEPGHKWLFLNFMRSCGLCFPLHQEGAKETEDSYYIFPEFLPHDETPAVKELWNTVRDNKVFLCRPDFLDYYRIQKFIVDIGNKTKVEYIWKSGILVITGKGKFRVDIVDNNTTIRVSMEPTAIEDYLWPIINTFNKGEANYEKINWLTEDGQILDLDSLKKRRLMKKSMSELQRGEISKRIQDTQLEDGKINLKTALPDVEQSDPKRLVISFASENLKDLESIVESLANYEFNGTIQVQYDDKVVDGRRSWDDDIKEMFINADGYLMLVSMPYQNFKTHTYIWEKEIPIIERRNKADKVFAYCISVGPVKYNDRLTKFAAFKGGKKCLPESGHSREAFLVEFAEEVVEGKFLNKK